jgi:hypothetical protein
MAHGERVPATTLSRELCRLLCRKQKSKRVDEVCRLRVGLSGWFKWELCTYTMSPHFVTTLCRLRFVPTLRPYALSKAKDGATGELMGGFSSSSSSSSSIPGTAGTAGTAGGWRQASACPRTCGRADARPSRRTPGIAAYALIRPPRVAHYVRKRF